MPCPGEGPCKVWPLDLACCLVTGALPDPCLNDGDPVPQVIVDQMKLAASQFLWRATGMQFGCCQVTIRPLCTNRCPSVCSGLTDSGFGFPWTPLLQQDGTWTNVTCNQDQNCSCVELCEIPLPYPVCSIDQVKIDGVVLGSSTYAVTNFNKLVKTTGLPQKHGMTGAAGPVGGPVVAGPVSVTGPLALPITDPYGNDGVLTSVDGSTYIIDFGTTVPGDLKSDPILEIQLAESGGTIRIDVPNNGRFEPYSISGGASITKVGNQVTVGPVTQSNRPSIIGIRTSDPQGDGVSKFLQLRYTVVSGGAGNGIRLLNVQWTVTGSGCWPECNNLTLPDTEEGTWSVTLTYGRPVPELLLLAANEFACQLIKRCVGKPCDLPQRVHSINRQGMSATFLDPMEFMKDGLTGIFLVDLAIKTYNPARLYKKPGVWSPDSLNRWAVQTWKSGNPTGPECS